MSKINVSNFYIGILHKFQEEAVLPEKYSYYFSGVVEQEGVPVVRDIYAYSSNYYNLVGKTSSEFDGSFLLPVTTSGTCYLVCLSDNSYNHLIAKQLNPIIKE